MFTFWLLQSQYFGQSTQPGSTYLVDLLKKIFKREKNSFILVISPSNYRLCLFQWIWISLLYVGIALTYHQVNWMHVTKAYIHLANNGNTILDCERLRVFCSEFSADVVCLQLYNIPRKMSILRTQLNRLILLFKFYLFLAKYWRL